VAPLLDIRNLTISFPVRGASSPTEAAAVRDVSFTVGSGEVLGLVGESGSGKSVTSLAIMRLLPPTAVVHGTIGYESKNITQLSDAQMRALRGRRIAMIFQEPMTALNPVMRVGDQVAEAVLAHNNNGQRVIKSEAWQKAVEALHTVAIPEPDRRARDYPHQLSGGQRQRVMIAIAIVNRPHLLIADEPTTALDVTVQAQILDLLADLRHKFGLAMLFISHDLAVVSQVADRIAVMYAGQIVETGPAHNVFKSPIHPYTRGLMNSVPTLRTDRRQPLRTIEGTVPAISSLPLGCKFEPRCDYSIRTCSQSEPPLQEVAPQHFVRCPVVTKP
jgi:oligopeptide/dipeptide ABC transporter ATP-binding protein